MPIDHETFKALGLDAPLPAEVNGRTLADFMTAINHPGDAAYNPCAEAYPAEDTPLGETTTHKDWSGDRIFPGVVRDVSVHTPVGLDKSQPARVIVFNDGAMYLNPQGSVRAARVLDTLHAKGEIRPTVAVFVNSGDITNPRELFKTTAEVANTQRSLEYDSLTPNYGRFLVEELLPFVERNHGLSFSKDPAHRTVCGISSGGIAAFTAAWHFPEAFGRVISHCGSYVNIRGGQNVPTLVRMTPRKPIRIFLQSGQNDANAVFGDWPLANQTLAKALDFAGYDHKFEFGTGGHSLHHGGAIFADTLRWLWRD